MLAFTRDAARAIRVLTASKGADGLRIHAGTRRFSRADAPSMHIELVYGPPVDEVVFEAEGARLYVDSETMRVLNDKVLHADAEMNRADWMAESAAAIGVKRYSSGCRRRSGRCWGCRSSSAR